MSLRAKVLLILALVFLVGGFWAYRAVYDNIRPQYLRVMEDGMVDFTYLLARMVEASLPEDHPEQAFAQLPIGRWMKKLRHAKIRARIYEWEKRNLDIRVYITDRNGIVRLDTDHGRDVGKDYSLWNDVYRALRGQYGARSSREQDSTGRNVNALYSAFPLYNKHKQVIGVLALAKSKASLTGWAERAQTKLWKGVLLGASVLFFLAFLLTHVALLPIFRLTQYAHEIAAGRRVAPPPVGKDEIGMLTQAFIEMKHALWQRRDIEQFVTQLTHELKSPICAIQGAAELLEDPDMPRNNQLNFLGNISDQARRMDDIVQRLLRLIALEQREALESKNSIPTDQLLKDLQQRFASQAQHRQLTLSIQTSANAPPLFQGDRFLLEQALTNLLQNSFHFTPPMGEITLLAFAERREDTHDPRQSALIFEVRDTGPGIPDYAIDRVTEKFYSLEHPDTGKKGTGLGLPFVKQVALLHGGDFTIQNSHPHGAIATFWLPL